MRGIQRYLCKDCGKKFSDSRRAKNKTIKQLWDDYVFGKQVFRELDCDKRTTRKLFDKYKSPEKIHHPRPVNIVTDATYFGERKEETSWCLAVVRDHVKKENLIWEFAKTESTSLYRRLRDQLEEKGYIILSVTADGFGGIRSAFYGIPFQMCLVHMERLVIRGTTRNPQLEAGQVLLALVRTIFKTNQNQWNKRFRWYLKKYQSFLNEKTTNPFTGEQYWTHKELRKAVNSLIRFRKYLFTFKQNKKIPPTIAILWKGIFLMLIELQVFTVVCPDHKNRKF
jgi:hypothetical protein